MSPKPDSVRAAFGFGEGTRVAATFMGKGVTAART